MNHVACESKLRPVVRSSRHPCTGNWMVIGRTVVYNARAAHAYSAGLKGKHCRLNTRTPSAAQKCEIAIYIFHDRLLGRVNKTFPPTPPEGG